jgi:CheY-like chemotaxis protein
MKTCLEQRGYEVTKTKNGEECLAALKNSSFDFVFLDVQSPHVDGVQVAQELRKRPTRIPLFLMSPFSEGALDNEEVRDHIDSFLSDLPPVEIMNRATLKSGEISINKSLFVDDQDKNLEILKDFLKDDKYVFVRSQAAKKLLVVDDQDMPRHFLRTFLGDQGYEISEARNGRECVDCATKDQFDAIFLDVRMPEMDGLQALRALREGGIKWPVFLMSGYSDVKSLEDAQKWGAQNFLPKPFELKKVLEAVHASYA